VIVLNTGPRRAIELACDLGPWIASASGKYEVRWFDGHGRPLRTGEFPGPAGRLTTGPMEPLDLALCELAPR